MTWTKTDATKALEEGWLMAYVVDSGQRVSTARYEIFDAQTPHFSNRREALNFVIKQAQRGSAFHAHAMRVCMESRQGSK